MSKRDNREPGLDDNELDDGEKSSFAWSLGGPAADNYALLGEALGAEATDLFRRPDGKGLLRLHLPAADVESVSTPARLWPLLVDRLNITVVKADGNLASGGIPSIHLTGMLASDTFLRSFLPLDEVVLVPTYLPGDRFELAERGYSTSADGRHVLYLGPEPEILRGHETIDRFLDVMAWDCDASRTNAVAAAVTIMLRRNWPGAKPLVLVTASKSHAGKDTTIDFAVGEEIASGGMTYQRTDWAVEQAVAGLLKRKPETAVMHFNNARLGIREQHIQSGFLERFITDAAPTIHSTKQAEPIRLRSNDKVVCISTNFGCVSEDLMNRSLPIHLTPDGDVQARRTPIGNPKLDYLPTHRARIAAELRGMIETWKEAGMPLDDAVEHPMTSWAKTVGGILRVSGYADFLENFRQRKTSDDPLRTGLAILGAHENGIWVTATDLVRRVCDLGLTKRIVPEGDRENEAAMARGLGIVLTAHVDETFEFIDPNSGRRLTLCLRKTPKPHRWTQYDKEHGRPPESSASREPHHRYRFDVE